MREEETHITVNPNSSNFRCSFAIEKKLELFHFAIRLNIKKNFSRDNFLLQIYPACAQRGHHVGSFPGVRFESTPLPV